MKWWQWLLPKYWFIGLIRLYQRCVPHSMRGHCRFVPTCSAYAVEALRRYGLIVGLGLAVWRLLRCNPFCHGGYDPVPEDLFKRKKK